MNLHVAIHLLNQFLTDHQPQSGTTITTGDRAVPLNKWLEQTHQLFFIHTNPGIADPELQQNLIPGGGKDRADMDIHHALFGKLDGIADNIGHDLLQTQRVAGHQIRDRLTDQQRQFQFLVMR